MMRPPQREGRVCGRCDGKGVVVEKVTVKGVVTEKKVACLPCNGTGRLTLLTK